MKLSKKEKKYRTKIIQEFHFKKRTQSIIDFWIERSCDSYQHLYTSLTSILMPGYQYKLYKYSTYTDTGEEVSNTCLLANCFPRGIKTDQFNYTSGEHQLVETNIEFTCTKYESIQINKVANDLINKHRILANSFTSTETTEEDVSSDY